MSARTCRWTRIVGHRGAPGVMPENTRPGFAYALQIGVDLIELDVVMTRDDRAAVVHDVRLNPDIARKSDGRWIEPPGPPVRGLTLAELHGFEVGGTRPGSALAERFPGQALLDRVRVPTLDEVLELVRPHAGAGLLVELKSDPEAPELTAPPAALAQHVLRLVREAGMERRVVVQSFDWRVLREVRQRSPATPTSHLTCEAATGAPRNTGPNSLWLDGHAEVALRGGLPTAVHAAGGAIWAPHHEDLTEPLLRKARDLGLEVFVWTVNDAAAMERALALGVDGLITDFPSRALRRRAASLAPV